MIKKKFHDATTLKVVDKNWKSPNAAGRILLYFAQATVSLEDAETDPLA